MKNFVVVFGAPRTGTSLTCELVKACGYNFGFIKPKHIHSDPRRGYNEHGVASIPFNPQDLPYHQRLIEEQGINAVKVIGHPEWINWLSDNLGYNVLIISTNRQEKTRRASAADMLVHIDSVKQKIQLQEDILAEKISWKVRHGHKYEVLEVDFEEIIAKELVVLRNIQRFIGDPKLIEIDHLLDVINPSQVKFK